MTMSKIWVGDQWKFSFILDGNKVYFYVEGDLGDRVTIVGGYGCFGRMKVDKDLLGNVNSNVLGRPLQVSYPY